jgi:hypothetical protein
MGIVTRERLKHIPQDLRHRASWTKEIIHDAICGKDVASAIVKM